MKLKSIFLIFLALLFVSCGKDSDAKDKSSEIAQMVEDEVPSLDALYEYSTYLKEYTAGIISVEDKILIRLNTSLESFKGFDNIELKKALIIKGVKGEWSTSGDRIQFIPSENLGYDSLYECKINFDEIYTSLPEEVGSFEFTVRTKKLDFDVTLGDLLLSPGNKENNYNFTGVIEFSDVVDNDLVVKALKADIDGTDIDVKWNHKGTKHSFTINNIERKKSARELNIKFDGNSFTIDKEFKRTVDILPIGVFTYLNHRVDRGATKVVTINFTSPLLVKQEFKSLISIQGDNNPRVTVSGSQLKIYPKNIPRGAVKVKVDKSLKSSARQSLNKAIELEVVIEQEYPEIKMIGSNGIVTGDKALYFPFEAVSLKAVDLRIIEIFESNIVQYLQDNVLGKGEKNLRRVAKPIYQGTVSLDVDKNNLMLWNRYHINLENYIDVNPGSMYQVEISFRRSLSLYGDPEVNELSMDQMEDQKWTYIEPKPAKESSYWDYYDDYEYNNNWQNRNDPNQDTYYSSPGRTKKRIVFATNMSIIAKRSDVGDLNLFVTDINTTEYIKGASVTVYNYQQQEIGTGVTDNNGFTKIDVGSEIPFVVKVHKDKDAGYLRLEDGAALNVSTFDTSGAKNPKGLKGFIYGERGVWRPGDRVYLHFILEDKADTLPEGHPIVMIVKNPKGAVQERIVKYKSENPIYPFIFETSKEDPTGNWSANIQVGGTNFKKTLMIESVKPNRLKIDLDFGVEEITTDQASYQGDLKVNWLHGAPGKNLKSEFSIFYKDAPTKFSNYSDYIFTDRSRKISTRSTQIFKGNVDENGYASVNLNINKSIGSAGKAKIFFSGKAYEESGDFSIRNFSIPYSPYDTYIGIKVPKGDQSRDMLLTDVDHTLRIVTVNSKGEPVSKNNLTAELFKIDWKWWWDQSAYSEVPNFVSSKGRTVIESGKVSTKNGEGKWKFSVSYPSWGRYYLRVKDGDTGHSTGRVVYIDWPGWAGRSTEGDSGVSRLFFSTDKKEYNSGDDIEVSFPSNEGSKALISIENGTDVIKTHWVDTLAKETKFKFKATKEMFPGAYIHITLIQPRADKGNDRPVRLYGILPVKVNDNSAKLLPVIKMNDTLRPNREVKINITEEQGRGMYYTLSIIDEGLLDLTNFITPNPYQSFFKREALGVKTWDIYDMLVGDSIKDYGSLLATGGGGGDGKEQKKEEVNRFKPVVKVFGPFKLNSGESKNHSFTMPNYVGSVRTMVTAASMMQYGAAEKTTPVKDPLMVLGTMPRVIGPKEKVSLPVTLFVMEESIKDVEVTVKTEGLINVKGDVSKKVSFDSVGDDIVYFDLETLEDIGTGKVIIEAKSGKHSSLYTVNMDVRPSNPYITKVDTKKVESYKKESFTVDPWGYKGSRSMAVEISSMPSINLDERLKYLIRYPHGCIEQTTSGVFPQLFLGDLKDLTKDEEEKIENNVIAGINRLKLFQTSSGGLSYWPGDNYASEWGSSYGGHFLVEADRAGFGVPNSLLKNWAKYQKKKARDYNSGSDNLNQAYRLYTLALYGEPEIGAMNRLFDKGNLSNQTKWRLAAAYGLTGNREAAESLVGGLGYNIKDYHSTSSSYGSSLRDRAMILETYTILGKNGYDLALEIANYLGSRKSYSTQTTAYSLLALSKIKAGAGIKAEVEADGVKIVVDSEAGLYSQKIPYSKNISVKNLMDGEVFVTVLSEGVEIGGEEEYIKKGLAIDTAYIMPKGASRDNLSSGTNFKLKVKVKNLTSQLQEEVALSVMVPGGWEIINKRLAGNTQEGESSYDYKDIRDDRVYYYMDLTGGEEKTFFVELNASYVGEYYMPSISADSMYNLDVKAQVPGQWIKVVPSN